MSDIQSINEGFRKVFNFRNTPVGEAEWTLTDNITKLSPIEMLEEIQNAGYQVKTAKNSSYKFFLKVPDDKYDGTVHTGDNIRDMYRSFRMIEQYHSEKRLIETFNKHHDERIKAKGE